jgi:hypothetical protein
VRHLDANNVPLRSDSLLYDESGNVIFSWTDFVAGGRSLESGKTGPCTTRRTVDSEWWIIERRPST